MAHRGKVAFVAFSCVFAAVFGGVALPSSEQEHDGMADASAIVLVGNARFTVLTDRVIRMEYSPSKSFVDSPSFTFVNRRLDVPKFTQRMDGDYFVIETSAASIRYDTKSAVSFNKDNLQVTATWGKGRQAKWVPGDSNSGNLFGTARTLDGVLGELNLDCASQARSDLHCAYGLVSKNGLVVVDDSAAPLFDDQAWPWVNSTAHDAPKDHKCAVSTDMKRDCGFIGITKEQCEQKGCCYIPSLAQDGNAPDRLISKLTSQLPGGVPYCFYSTDAAQDLYVFAHGTNYKDALGDFIKVAGRIPMPPRYSLGVFYSRYWSYSDHELQDLANEYVEHTVPLDVMVVDMDWHKTFYLESSKGVKDQAGQPKGWSGFTWDPRLFPNPKAFLVWMKERGLRVTVNIHPASGIQPWEDKYDTMARLNGIDPSTEKYVPFKSTDEKFVRTWFAEVMDKLQDDGIDFYWLDWQQGEGWIEDNEKIPRVNPTFWLNYLFFTNPAWKKRSESRPHLLHRWGGLGNHRYQLGFSGDVVPDWKSLDFQPYFTATAANVLYGYWSHDLGGHTEPSPPELYTRWVQWGAFSPVFRTHCTKNALNDRRIWSYPSENYKIMREYMVLRALLNPYIYAHAHVAHETGVSLLRPLYYEYPELDEAYTMKNEYFFGENMVAHPITAPVDETTGLAKKDIFIPDGEWVGWWTGEHIFGPKTVTRAFSLSEMPLYVRAGRVIPMRFNTTFLGEAVSPADSLELRVHAPSDDSCEAGCESGLYDDDGVTDNYLEGGYAWSKLMYTQKQGMATVSVAAASKSGVFVPADRAYKIVLVGVMPPTLVKVEGNAASEGELTWSYDGATATLSVLVGARYVTSEDFAVHVTMQEFSPAARAVLNQGYAGLLSRAKSAKQQMDAQWGIHTIYMDEYPNLLVLSETGSRIAFDPTTADSELAKFTTQLETTLDEIKKLTCSEKLKQWLVSNLSLQ